MKYFVLISLFFIGAVLIGAVGILCPFLLFNYQDHSANLVPSYIFSVYCIVFGALLIVVELRIQIIIKIFLFLASYNHRAIFIIFLGTLAMCAYNRMEQYQWIGYAIGGLVVFMGILHIAVGCFDGEWVKEQNAKYLPKDSLSQPAPATGYGKGPQPTLDNFFGQPGPQPTPQQQGTPGEYPSLASDQSMMGGDPRRQMVGAAAQMPETQKFAAAATGGMVQNMLAGQNAENAAVNAFSNPEVQRAAFTAGVAAAQNPAVQRAAGQAAQAALSNAYDQLFD